MRDPDSQVRARRQLEICDAPPGLGSATSSGFAGQDTEPRFAGGTHAGDRVGPPDGAGERAALDLAAIPRASLAFDACGRIVDVNPLAETLFGYARFELVGEPVDLIASKLASVEQPGAIRFLSATAGACVRHRSGRAIPVDVLLCPRDEWSTAVVFRAVETTDAGLRGEDVAEIVHDLKNPLSTIALEACLLDDKLAHGHPSDTRDALARINRNVEFLDRMVRDLLDLCSLDAGHLELHRRPTELRMLLERIIDRVVPTRDRGRVSLHAAEPLTTSIDDLRIERVVANLLQNALKYAPKITGIVVGLVAVNDAIRVSVTDAGPGMTPAETGCVFDKFQRASTAGSREGSGLGLYVSRKIVEAHGGRIDVTSVQGAGSQFFFELPVT
jgi:PAS domain S-box-containing protein